MMIYHDLPVLLREVSLPHEVPNGDPIETSKKNSVPYTPHESQRWQPLPAPMRGFEVLVCPMREKSWLIVTCGVDHLAAFLQLLGIGVGDRFRNGPAEKWFFYSEPGCGMAVVFPWSGHGQPRNGQELIL